MVYTVDIVDGKIEIPKRWRDKKRVRMREESSHLIIDFDSSDNILDEDIEAIEYNEDEDGMHVHFKKGVRAGDLHSYLEKHIL